jgi:hypothetical protein
VACSEACYFRGDDESIESSNHGNFIEMIKYLATLDEEIANVVLEKFLEMLNIRHQKFKRKS